MSMSETPHPFVSDDPMIRLRALQKSLRDEGALRPRVDSQGRPVDPVKFYEYDDYGMLIGPGEDTA